MVPPMLLMKILMPVRFQRYDLGRPGCLPDQPGMAQS
jgi:hypothetical protein